MRPRKPGPGLFGALAAAFAFYALACSPARGPSPQVAEPPASSEAPRRALTIYSPHAADMTDFVVAEFRRRTGIRARVVSAGTGALIDRLRSEAAEPEADVFWGGGVDSLDSSRSLFSPYRSREDAAVPAEFKDRDYLWNGFSVLPIVLLYNARLVPPSRAPRGWRDLADPYFRGRVAFADPASSGSSYTALVTFLAALSAPRAGTAEGPIGSAESWAFADALAASLRGSTLAESRYVYEGVAAGEWFAGISFETAVLDLARAGSDVRLVYPREGTTAVPDGVAVVAGAPRRAEAEAFVDFVLGKDVQAVVSRRWLRRSVRKDVPAPAAAPPLSELVLVEYPRAAAVRDRGRVLSEWERRLDRAAGVPTSRP